MPIPNTGLVFERTRDFLSYIDGLTFGAWRPRFVTVHHTGAPNLRTWNGWQTRTPPITDKQWLSNLANYYGSPPPFGPSDGPWLAGPHFMVTPKHICVLSPPTRRGTHARSFNATSWGVETVGDFDVESFTNPIRAMLVDTLAALHVGAGLRPTPYQFNQSGLHFHRDDPLTSKSCPGRNITKGPLIASVKARMLTLVPGEQPVEMVGGIKAISPPSAGKVTAIDGLSVRSGPSAMSPKLYELAFGGLVTADAYSMNGDTKWVRIRPEPQDEWVAAKYVQF